MDLPSLVIGTSSLPQQSSHVGHSGIVQGNGYPSCNRSLSWISRSQGLAFILLVCVILISHTPAAVASVAFVSFVHLRHAPCLNHIASHLAFPAFLALYTCPRCISCSPVLIYTRASASAALTGVAGGRRCRRLAHVCPYPYPYPHVPSRRSPHVQLWCIYGRKEMNKNHIHMAARIAKHYWVDGENRAQRQLRGIRICEPDKKTIA